MAKLVDAGKFVLAFVLAGAAAVLVQWLLTFVPTQQPTVENNQDLVALMLALIILNLATFVAFVLVQSRVLGFLFDLRASTLIVRCAMCGPIAAMLGFFAYQRYAVTALAIMPLVIGQIVLWVLLRKDASATRSLSDSSSQ